MAEHKADKSFFKILDNREGGKLGDALKGELSEKSRLRIVSAYFSIYAYSALQGKLDALSKVQFLFGRPDSISDVDPGEKEGQAFLLSNEGLRPTKVFQQKRLAKDCAEWIRKKVSLRTIRQANFLHGKMYHIEHPDSGSFASAGSSNFTYRGLGYGRANIEINLAVETEQARASLATWFDGLWQSEIVKDAKKEVLDALERQGREYSPRFVYYKTLFHVLEEYLKEDRADSAVEQSTLYDTEIWKKLYQFQKDGVKGIINRLMRHGGCILADSVGLGKTFEALAVMQFFMLRNERVLVLCPKRLNDNWLQYAAYTNQKHNPFARDRLNYTVLAHTDLSREKGKSNGIELENFNWGNHDLVVIDESHNFRNDSGLRYRKLIESMKEGMKTKVLMLSATPVNNSLTDLQSQISLMTEERENALHESLGVRNVKSLLREAQRTFEHWQNNSEGRDKQDLLKSLGGEFFHLLDGISIARGREHIKKHYKDFIKEQGDFPQRETPKNFEPPTDIKEEISYSDIRDRITQFQLFVYRPAHYLKNDQPEQENLFYSQKEREYWLVGMMRVNFLKRLESSAYALCKTLERTLGKIESAQKRIENYVKTKQGGEIEADIDYDEEDEDFIVGRKQSYHMSEIDYERWAKDLEEDREVIKGVLDQVGKVTPDRDGKLSCLRDLVLEKIGNHAEGEKANRKILIFTSSADTAEYLFSHLEHDVKSADAEIAQISGSRKNQATTNASSFGDILNNFSPVARERNMGEGGKDIDVLIATDCVSEGQNLQDCDMVVNYDIHWNPVRLIQRFGRIDRLGSKNDSVKMVNFWPTKDLEEYLNLAGRVNTRMILADVSATDAENLLNPKTEKEWRERAEREVGYRDNQLKRLRDEVIDLDEAGEGGITLSDFTLDDFLAELRNYLESNREELESAPMGLYALAPASRRHGQEDMLKAPVGPGVIFCLRRKGTQELLRRLNPLYPYFMIYVGDDGEVRARFVEVKRALTMFGDIARDIKEPVQKLCAIFDRETERGRDMSHYDNLLGAALKDISAISKRENWSKVMRQRNYKPSIGSDLTTHEEDYELVSWLVIKDGLAA